MASALQLIDLSLCTQASLSPYYLSLNFVLHKQKAAIVEFGWIPGENLRRLRPLRNRCS